MRKILLSLLASALMFSAVSCGAPTGNNAGSEKEPVTGVELEQNVGGTFVIKTESTSALSLVPDSGDDVRNDLVDYRYREIGVRFNCTVSASVVQEGTLVTNLSTAAAASGMYADLVELSAAQIYDLYKGGYLAAAQDVVGMDISDEKWGYEGQKAMMTFGDGKTYGFRNAYWAIPLQNVSNVLFYNDNLIAKNMLTSPYEYYESDSWNWDAFEEICKDVTQNVNDLQSIYGFMIPNAKYPDFIHAAIYSNGGQRLKEDEFGRYVCGYFDSKTMEALEWVRDLVNKEQVCYIPGNLSSADNVDVMSFTDQYTVFLVSDSGTGFYNGAGYPMTVLEDGFRWVEFPEGKGFDGKATSFYTKDDTFLALSHGFDAENKGIVLNAIFEPLKGEDTESWKSYVAENYFFYEEDAELYFDLLKDSVSDFSVLTLNTNDSIDDIFESVITGKKSAKEAVEMLEPVVSGLLE